MTTHTPSLSKKKIEKENPYPIWPYPFFSALSIFFPQKYQVVNLSPFTFHRQRGRRRLVSGDLKEGINDLKKKKEKQSLRSHY